MPIQVDARVLPSRSRRRAIRCGLLSLLSLALLVSPLQGQDGKEVTALEEGRPIERELGGGQSHSYRAELAAGQFLHVTVEQRSVDVVITVFGPGGQKLSEVDSPDSGFGLESVSLIAAAPGSYRLEVRPYNPKAAAGRYEIRLDALRAATAKDRMRLSAETGLAEARRLAGEARTPEAQSQAGERLAENVSLWRQVGDGYWEAVALGALAAARRAQGRTEQALESYGEALKYWRSAGNLARQASTLYGIGAAYDEADQNRQAVERYQQALGLYRQLKDRLNEAGTLYAIGTTYHELHESQKALELLAEAAPLYRAAGDRRAEVRTLNYMGDVYLYSNQREQALRHYKDALSVSREIRDRRGEVDALNNVGLIHTLANKADAAVMSFTQARELAQAAEYTAGEARALNGLGIIHQRTENPSDALTYHNQALSLWRKIGDKEGEAQTLTDISICHALLRESGKARESAEQASPLIEGLRNEGAEASGLYSVGLLHLSAGEFQKAIDSFERMMAIARGIRQEKLVAHVPALIGLAYYLLGEDQKALEHFTSALPALQETGNRSAEALAHAGIAAVERDRGNLGAARARMETALRIFQSLRGDLSQENLRISVFASAQDLFGAYIDILMRQHGREPSAGHDAEAFEASELGRARSLLDSLNESKADIRRGVSEELLQREQSLRQRLSMKAQQQRLRLLDGGDAAGPQAQADKNDIESLTIELQQTLAEIRRESPAYAALTQPQPLTFKEVQTQVLDADTLLLEYSLSGERGFLWAVTPDNVVSYVLPASAEIEAAARQVYELLNARTRAVEGETAAERRRRVAQADAEYPAAAARLSRMALAPAKAQLGSKRLLIVTDGALQYVPVAALPDPNADPATFTPLLLGHEVVGALSASTLAFLRNETRGRPLAPKGVAVLADPVFGEDDERLRRTGRVPSEATPGRADAPRELKHERPAGDGLQAAGQAARRIKRLPYSRQEAEEILKVAGPEGSTKVLDFAANRQFVTDPRLGGYRYLHFATHGFSDSDHPEVSGIVLSMVDENGGPQDGFLWAHEIYNLKLPVELVVLSACQTGLGKEVKGEGLMGLTRGFMYAGAPRVVVSLWSVSDRATAELMGRFYRGMLKEKMRPAAALRAAQLSMMKERGWESPFYWAAFTLQGEWR